MRPLNRRRHKLLKVLALLSQIRWYNILLLLTGQYLIAVFVFSDPTDRMESMRHLGIHFIIWSGALALSFGFLINSFYDLEADSINRPNQTALERLVSRPTSLRTAIFLGITSLLLALSVSFKAAVFYGIYMIALWFYSHKLRNIPIVSHTSAAVLAMVPFFGLSVYENFLSLHTFAYGALLGLTLFSRELLKDLLMLKGDVITGRSTVASEYGIENTKFALLVSNSIAWVPAFFTRDLFSRNAEIGIFLMLVILSVSNLATLRTNDLRGLRWAHLGYKIVLVLGVLTLPFL